MSVANLALPATAFALAGFVQGLSGFGSGMVAMALLPLVWPVDQAVAVAAVFGMGLNVAFSIHLRAHGDWREVVSLAVPAVAGVPIGLWFLHHADGRLATGALGAVLVVFAAWSLLHRAAVRPLGRIWAWLAGLAAGVLSGALNTAGPPTLIYATLRGWQRDAFRANMQLFFTAVGAFTVIGFAATGLITSATLQLNLMLALPLAVGAWLGNRLCSRVDQLTFRRGVLLALLAMGTWYLLRLV